ncbi:MAG: ThuA domain-containing protein [Bacillus subtilis]|nr:ThuA domain-containing protein [Bacillus subtilis]
MFEQLKPYDLCVCLIDRWTPLSDDQSLGLTQFVKQGGGLLVLHNGLSLQARPELAKLLGGYFTGHPEETVLTYQTIPSQPWITSKSAILALWKNLIRFVSDNAFDGTVFLQYRWHETLVPAGWTRLEGHGKIVVLSPGHHLETFLVEGYRTLIHRCALWATSKANETREHNSF